MVTRADCASRSWSRRARALTAILASALYAASGRAQPDTSGAPSAQPVPSATTQPAPGAASDPGSVPPPGEPSPAGTSAAGPPPPSRAPAPAPGAGAAPPQAPSRPLAEAIALEAGDTCLEHEMLARRVGRWLQRDVVDARIRVQVRGSDREPNAVSFAITFEGGHPTERNIRDAPADCDQFHSALALSIALAIDATLLDAQRAQPPGEDVPSDEELLAVEPPEPGYFRLAFGVFAHATSGLLTDVAPAGSARIEVGLLRWLDLRAGALGSWVEGQHLPGVDGDFDVRLIAGRLDVCGVVGLRQLRLLACAGAMGGSFRTHGRGFSARSFTDTKPWWAAVGSVELHAEITGWLTLAVAIDLAVPLLERWIVVLGPDERAQPPAERKLTAVGVLAGAGPVFRFF